MGERVLDKKELLFGSGSVVILIGPATSGKTSIADKIEGETAGQVERIKGKDILPEMSVHYSTERNRVPDELFLPALGKRLGQVGPGGIILENIPRTSEQAQLVKYWVEASHRKLRLIVLDLGEDEVVDRASNRFECPDCGSTYHHQLKPSRHPGVCDNDNSVLRKKSGDSEEALRRQYKEYQETLRTVMDVFDSSANVQVSVVNASGKVSELEEKVINLLRSD